MEPSRVQNPRWKGLEIQPRLRKVRGLLRWLAPQICLKFLSMIFLTIGYYLVKKNPNIYRNIDTDIDIYRYRKLVTALYVYSYLLPIQSTSILGLLV